MPTLPIFLKKMKKSEYFKEISKKTHEKRNDSVHSSRKKKTKGEFSAEEMEIYHQGEIDALLSVMQMATKRRTYGEVMNNLQAMMKFLERERDRGKLATLAGDGSLWTDGKWVWSAHELYKLVEIHVADLISRLKKSRDVHAINAKIIRGFMQTDIEGLFPKEGDN